MLVGGDPMLLTELEKDVAGWLAASTLNGIARMEALSTAPVSAAPLRIFDPPLLAVADAEDPLWARLKAAEVIGPEHRSPGEWLPGARSVVSYFLPYSETVRRANRGQGTTATEWLYGRWEGDQCNVALARRLAQAALAAGAQALAPMVDGRYRVVQGRSNWSERHAAFIAGLGTFSLSRSLITRRGSAGRFGSIITDAVLEPTPRPYQGLTEYCSECGSCIPRCPPRGDRPIGEGPPAVQGPPGRHPGPLRPPLRLRQVPRPGCPAKRVRLRNRPGSGRVRRPTGA